MGYNHKKSFAEPLSQSGAKNSRTLRAARIKAAQEERAAKVARIAKDFGIYGADYYIAQAKPMNNHREFILHIGPTNSGKTYEAINRLMQSGNGAYLAPLRLLALEMYDKLNHNGVPCELLTGEEYEEMPGAEVIASTIEMCNYNMHYDVAVIDEAQMVSDPFRGAHWTKAIYLIDADEVHICMAPEAEKLITGMIEGFGGHYKIERHERLSPLVFDGRIKADMIQTGDALIVFTRREVLGLAAELEDAGHKVSCIYGALPPMSRREEVRKFVSGETDVVVATDAIGMGVSIPIKRIVFTSIFKFDGVRQRKLYPAEIKQIAGRAGRYGIFDEGHVAVYDLGKRPAIFIRECLTATVPDIGQYMLPFPDGALDLGYSLDEMFSTWLGMINVSKNIRRADVKEFRDKYELLKRYIPKTASLRDIFSLVCCPSDRKVQDYWLACSKLILAGRGAEIPKPGDLSEFCGTDLASCEIKYKALDVYHNMMRKLGMADETVREREELCMEINRLLKKERRHHLRKCLSCGAPLSFKNEGRFCKRCSEAYKAGYVKTHRKRSPEIFDAYTDVYM